jgi:hypothetical protein
MKPNKKQTMLEAMRWRRRPPLVALHAIVARLWCEVTIEFRSLTFFLHVFLLLFFVFSLFGFFGFWNMFYPFLCHALWAMDGSSYVIKFEYLHGRHLYASSTNFVVSGHGSLFWFRDDAKNLQWDFFWQASTINCSSEYWKYIQKKGRI